MELGLSEETMGTKRLCQSCAAKYYDFSASPVVCPTCGTEFDPEAVMRSRRGRVAASAIAASKEDAETAETQLEDSAEIEDTEDDVLADDAALADDDATVLADDDDEVDIVDDVVDVALEEDVDLEDEFSGSEDDGTLLEDDEEDLGDHGLSEVEFGDNSEDE